MDDDCSHMSCVCPACTHINRVPGARLTDGPKCGTCKEALFTGRPIDLHRGNFQQHLTRNDIPMVVDFWAPWCGPCRIMAPIFAQATTRLEPFVRLGKLNTDSEPAMATRLGIRGIPTVVMFKDGQEIKRRDGAMGSGHVHPMGSITRRLAVLDVGARMRLLLTLFRLFPLDALSL